MNDIVVAIGLKIQILCSPDGVGVSYTAYRTDEEFLQKNHSCTFDFVHSSVTRAADLVVSVITHLLFQPQLCQPCTLP